MLRSIRSMPFARAFTFILSMIANKYGGRSFTLFAGSIVIFLLNVVSQVISVRDPKKSLLLCVILKKVSNKSEFIQQLTISCIKRLKSNWELVEKYSIFDNLQIDTASNLGYYSTEINTITIKTSCRFRNCETVSNCVNADQIRNTG